MTCPEGQVRRCERCGWAVCDGCAHSHKHDCDLNVAEAETPPGESS